MRWGGLRCVGLFLDILDMSRCGLKAAAANSAMLLCEDPHVQVGGRLGAGPTCGANAGRESAI